MQAQLVNLTAALENFLNPDQISSLSRKQRGARLSYSTLARAFQLRIACGEAGYEQLLVQGYPLPSMRTILDRLGNLTFTPGVNYEILESLSSLFSNESLYV